MTGETEIVLAAIKEFRKEFLEKLNDMEKKEDTRIKDLYSHIDDKMREIKTDMEKKADKEALQRIEKQLEANNEETADNRVRIAQLATKVQITGGAASLIFGGLIAYLFTKLG